tara:strand:- start:6363 stop:6572 length:210 start_codon:yes stop_codon:yes gene_type:complete
MAQVALPETKDDIDEYLDSYARAQEAMSGEAPDKEEMARVRQLVEEAVSRSNKNSKKITLTTEDNDEQS